MQTLNDLLYVVGLESKEISIYTFLYFSGGQTAGTISSRLDINRSHCYTILEKMVRKGYLAESKNAHTHLFLTISPQILISNFKRQNQNNLVQISRLEKQVFDQFNPHSSTVKPTAVYHHGKAGLLNIMNQVIQEKPDILRAHITRGFQDFILQNAQNYNLDRSKNNITARALYPMASVESNSLTSQKDLRQSRSIREEFSIGLDCLIFNDKIALLSPQEEFGTVIQSPSISKAKTDLFDLAWGLAKAI